MKSSRIAVIGGGIGGLAAALALKQGGHAVTVYEKHPYARNGGTGLTLWSNAAYALDQLGILHEVLARGQVMRTSRIMTARNRLIAELPLHKLQSTVQYPTFSISRTSLHHILIDSVGKDSIIYGKRCVAFQQTQDEAVVRFEDGTTAVADLVVAADGIHSILREQWLKDRLRYSGYVAWQGVTSVNAEQPAVDVMYEYWGAGRRFGFVPLGERQVYWFATQNAEPGLSLVSMKDHLQRVFGSFPKQVRSTLDAAEEADMIQTALYDRVPARSFVNGRLVLVGDAAHPTTPNMGQGACMALEDAVALSEAMHESTELLAALRMYDRLRVKKTAHVVRTSWSLGKVMQIENRFLCSLRNGLVKLTPSALQNRQWINIISPYKKY